MWDEVRWAASRRTVLALVAGGLGAVPALARAAPAVARAAPPPIPHDQAGLRAWYDRYIDAFNRSDFETFSAYYADDITFESAAGSTKGLAAVLDDFHAHKRVVHQTSKVIGFVGSPDRISVEFHSTTIGLKDDPNLSSSSPNRDSLLKKGERREAINFAIYDLRDGRFARARWALFRNLPANAAL